MQFCHFGYDEYFFGNGNKEAIEFLDFKRISIGATYFAVSYKH